MRNLLLGTLLLFVIRCNLYAQNCSINAGTNVTICQTAPMTLFGTQAGLFGGNSKWTQISGPAVIIDYPDSLVTTVHGYTAGTYLFRLSIKCQDGINAEDYVTITVLPQTLADAGRDSIYCPSSGLQLYGNAPLQTGEFGSWSYVTANYAGVTILSTSNPASPITLATGAAGATILKWTLTNNAGCTSSDVVSITNLGGIAPVNAGPDQVLGNCFSTSTCTNLLASNGGTGLGGQVGLWSFVSGPSIPTINPVNSPATRVCNLTQGTYVFRYTVTGPCINGSDDVTVSVPVAAQDVSMASAGSNTIFCGLVGTTTLHGNIPLYAGENVIWSQTSGPSIATIVTPDNPSSTVTGLSKSGSYCFTYKITNGTSGCSSNAPVCYTLYNTGTVDGGPDQILSCNITTATIPTKTTGEGALSYRIISGPPGPFTYPTLYKISNVVTGMTYPGTYRIEINYYFGEGCPSVSDFVDITVSLTPTNTNAGTDQIFACTASSTQLAGNNPPLTGLGYGRWSQVSGPNTATIVTPNNYISDVRGTIPGSYTFRWTVSGGNNCPDNFDDMMVVIPDTTLTKSNAGPDRTVCYNSPIFLQGNNFRVDETARWTVSPGGITFSPSNTVPTPVITGLAANTTYTFVYTVTNSCNVSSRDTMVITTGASQGPSASNAGTDQCLTGNSTVITLNATAPAVGNGIWTQLSGPSSTITNPLQRNTTVTGVTKGTYQFLWTVTVPGCSNVTTDTAMVTISDSTTKAKAGADSTFCGSSYTMRGNTPLVGTGKWTQIAGDGSAIITDLSNPVSTLTHLFTGTYIFRWTITNGTCASDFDEVTLRVSLPPTAANAGLDLNLCGVSAGTATLNAAAPVAGTGQWVQVSGPVTAVITNNTLRNTTVTGLTNGQFTFRWIVTGGPACPQTSDDMVVTATLPANAGTDQNLCNLTSTSLKGNTGSTGTWTQVSGPAVTLSQIPANNPIVNISGLTVGATYVFRYTIPITLYGCPASFDDVSVFNGTSSIMPNAGNDSAFCNASSFALNGSIPHPGETGTWTVISGQINPTFSPNANTPNAMLTNASPGIYILRWTISNSTCSSSDVKRIDNYAPPSIANAGSDQKVCFKQATLHATTPVNGIGKWTQISGPLVTTIGAINNPVSPVTGFDSVGTYKFVWTITNGPICSSTKDTVSLVVSGLSPTLPDAGIDQHLCNQASTFMGGNTPSIGTGVWTKASGPTASITTPNSPSTEITSLVPGVYQFVWKTTNSDASCFATDTVTVLNSVAPNTANAGVDDSFCVFSNVFLNANKALAGTTGKWSLVSGPNTPVFISPDSARCQVTGFVPGTYKFSWTISSPFCLSSSDEVNITIINNADAAIAGINQNICGTSVTLNASVPTGSNKGLWTQVAGPNTATITSPTSPTSTITNVEDSTYRFEWKIYNERCFTTDTINLTFGLPATVNAGTDFISCNNILNVPLNGASIGGSASTGIWTIITGNGTLTDTDATTSPDTVRYILAPAYSGTVVLRLATNDPPGFCPAVTDDISIDIRLTGAPLVLRDDSAKTGPNIPITIEVLANDTTYEESPLTLCDDGAIIANPAHGSVVVNANGSIIYTPNNGYTGLDSFMYQVCEYCDPKGRDSAEVFVTIDGAIIPDAISPNNDGVNDFFVVPFAGNGTTLSIWNRWGIEVYKTDHYNNDWNGTYNGGQLPDGTYYYTLKYSSDRGEDISKAGFISLHR